MKNAKIMLKKILLAGAALTLFFLYACKQKPGQKSVESKIEKFTVTFGVDGQGGGLEAAVDGKTDKSGSIEVESGKTVTFTAKPEDSYKVKSWAGLTSAPNPPDSETVELKITKAENVKVKFVLDNGNPNENEAEKFEVRFSVENGSGSGTLIAKPEGAGALTPGIVSGSSVPKDTVIVFTAAPAPDSKLERWIGITPVPANSLTAKLKITKSVEIKVQFKKTEVTENNTPSDKEFIAGTVTFKMKGIAEVVNGTLGDEKYNNNKSHTVSLSAYLIGETEVTQELYHVVTGKNPSFFKNNPYYGEEQLKRPVEMVNWFEALYFCNALTEKSGMNKNDCVYYSDEEFQKPYTAEDSKNKKIPFPDWSKKGFRLPTEAEWEWAARAGKNYQYSGSDKIDEVAWYSKNGSAMTHEVKKLKQNDFGLYDMTGNVWEWCWDWYGRIDANIDLGKNPRGQSESYNGKRIKRGGCWRYGEERSGCTYRSFHMPEGSSDEDTDSYLGIRIVCTP